MRQIDTDLAIQRLAERRIEEAMREGKFDNLPGRGMPVDLDDMPADERARMVWWALKLMRNAGRTPDEVRWRKRVDALRDELAMATSEDRVRSVVGAINVLVKQVNTVRAAGQAPLVAADLGREIGRLHARRRQGVSVALDLSACANELCASANPSAARYCRRCGGRMG
jgi:hypothetical protein